MISKKDKKMILKMAKSYHLKSVYLFGSSIGDDKFNDIDIAIQGIAPNLFFKLYWELMENLSVPVDLINLDRKNNFQNIVQKNGLKIYGN
jgi:predicted nucleotidyltransferase